MPRPLPDQVQRLLQARHLATKRLDRLLEATRALLARRAAGVDGFLRRTGLAGPLAQCVFDGDDAIAITPPPAIGRALGCRRRRIRHCVSPGANEVPAQSLKPFNSYQYPQDTDLADGTGGKEGSESDENRL